MRPSPRAPRRSVPCLLVHLALLGAARCEEPPAGAAAGHVLGHVCIQGIGRFATAVSDCYGDLGLGADLLPAARVERELERSFPVPALAGVDRSAPFGFLLARAADGSLRPVPFCRVADPRDLAAALRAVAADGFQVREAGRATLFVPAGVPADPLARHVATARLLEPSPGEPHLRLWCDVRELTRGADDWMRTRITLLRVLGSLHGLVHTDGAPAATRAAAILDRSWNSVLAWTEVEAGVWFEPSGLQVEARLVPRAGSNLAAWLAAARPLPQDPLPGPPGDAWLVIEGAVAPSLLHRMAAGAPGALLAEPLASASGEFVLALAGVSPPAILVVTGTRDAEGLRGRLAAAAALDGTLWTTAHAGNWSVLGAGGGAAPRVLDAVRRIEAAPPPVVEPAADVALRGSVSLPHLLAALRGGPAPGELPESVRFRGRVQDGALELAVVVPLAQLRGLVPEVDLR